jgi:glutamate-1-semialdehyde aminotransferase|tara:strand:+ start:2123 stop:3400 length:1278 start_codon:yes stop_codon:yes gene_type:complete
VVSKKNNFISSKTNSLKKEGLKVIPGLTQTLAKSPTQFSENFSPLFSKKGKGAFITDYENNSLIDTMMGIGPLILGYSDPSINNAIKKQLKKGIVFSLINPLEIKLAQELSKIVPGMDMFRFSKTGADSTSAAIRAARSFTSKKKILSCGYHGWHDWNAITLNKNSGILKENKKYIKKFSYNDFESLADNLDSDVAAVIMEPIIFDFPKNNFLQKIRKITKQKKTLLIFDEMWTGFRLHLGGAQSYFKIKADLVCYSKAIANGMPISVLGGTKKIMQSFGEKSFFYTTFGGEVLSMAAALECMKILKKKNVCKTVELRGFNLIKEMNSLINAHKLNYLNVKGYGARSILNIQHDEALIIKTFIHQEFLKRGILWNGVINLSFSHDVLIVKKIIHSFNEILVSIKKIGLYNLNKHINGKLIKKLIL